MAEARSAREKIMRLEPFPVSSYDNIDLNRLTVLTIHLLLEEDIPPVFENIVACNYRLFPERFAMVGFPEYPDATRVNRALLQLRPKYRNWASGKTRTGWALTPAGLAEAKALLQRTRSGKGNSHRGSQGRRVAPAATPSRTIDPADVTARIRRLPLYAKRAASWAEATALEVFDLLEAYPHTPKAALRRRLNQMQTMAASAGDDEVVAFLKALRERFAVLFRD